MTTATLAKNKPAARQEIRVRRSVAVRRTVRELYAFWHDLPNIPRILSHLKAVTVTGADTSHWIARTQVGGQKEWNVRINEDPNERWLAWSSEPDGDVETSGLVSFNPGSDPHETLVTVSLSFAPATGTMNELLAALFAKDPGQQVAEDLEVFRSFMEHYSVAESLGRHA